MSFATCGRCAFCPRKTFAPHGRYTMRHAFAVWPPTEPFIGFYDLPFGAPDGSESAFQPTRTATPNP